ncbi:hypothetical protein [Microbacterium phyllosphaerae]|uniref:hypothetical protein n=1 Tax=Microbacterium phyllosphaerae TaxID=124798 RepID=UPI000EA1171F|nr:hypothetical protein [Microbacterium phyllosphaerae]
MDAAAEEELRELRARAYGPHADIETDPAALRRLQELESSRAASSARLRAGGVTALDAPAAATELRLVIPAADESRASDELLDRLGDDSLWDDPVAHDQPTEDAGWRSRLARWRMPLWVASVVAAAAVAAAVTFALTSMPSISSSAGAPQIETLELARTGAVPPGWFGAETDVAAAEFFGLTVFESPGWVSESGDRSSENRCISVVRTVDVPDEGADDGSSSISGPMYAACSIGAFPAEVVVPIDGEMPEQLIERYPSGVALQFVLDGDRVGVFLDSSKE